MKKLFILLAFIFCPTVLAQIQEYKIVDVRDTSISQIRVRGQVWIMSPEANTLQDRADTAKQAALDVVALTDAKAVSIFLLPNEKFVGSGYHFATVRHYTDGCGNSGAPRDCNGKEWEVWASKVQLTELQLRIAEEIYAPNPPASVLDEFGLPDEEKLKKYIAKKLKIKVSDVEKNLIYLEPEQIN